MIITAKVRTNQPEFSVRKGEIWLISVKSPPERNRANAEIVEELSKMYKSVRIVSGFRSGKKKIALE